MYIPIWILIIFAIILYFILRKNSKNGKDLLRDENNKKEKKLTFEILDERSYTVFKDEYNSYWARQSYHRILDFYNYAKPISNKEKSEATTTIEFQLALGYMPYGGNPADNPEGFTIWEQEWKKERQDRFSENFISLTTNLPDRFVNLVLFGKDAENEDGTDVEEAVPEQKLTKSEEEIVLKTI